MLKNMKIRKSLILGFGMVIVISLAIIVITLVMMVNQQSQYEALLNEDAASNEYILYARLNAVMAGRNIRDALLVPDSEANDGLINTAEKCLEDLTTYLSNLQDAFPERLPRDLLNAYVKAAETWAEGAPLLIDYYEQYRATGDDSYLTMATDYIYTTDTPNQDTMAAAADQLDAQLVEGMADQRASIEASVVTTLIVVICVLVAAVIFVIAFAMILIRSITGPTEEVRNALVGFSQGKLDIPVKFESRNELGEMCAALRSSQDILNSVIGDVDYLLREMAGGNFSITTRAEAKYVGSLSAMLQSIRAINRNLSDTLAQINQSADQVSAGSEQVSTGAQALAQGATEQASAVEQLSATINEIATGAEENAKNSQLAMEHTREAGESVNESAQLMEQMVEAMKKISDSSEEIGKIIATIENIAFQTNILALNAAVEAARAGTAGKGFAVVADEVRNLASKSDQAAKATKDLIENTVTSVRESDVIVRKVADALNKTTTVANQVLKDVERVATAVEAEAESIQQVTEGVDQISSVVQTNSATSEESAAASEELSSQASIMKELMAHFRLRESDGYTPSLPAHRGADAAAAEPVSSGFSKY